MRTSIETKTNTALWVEKQWNNSVETTRIELNNSLISALEKKDILSRRWIERSNISRETFEQTKPLTDETHFRIENELAQMFWLWKEKVSKLGEDFEVPLTLSGVLADAETYWQTA